MSEMIPYGIFPQMMTKIYLRKLKTHHHLTPFIFLRVFYKNLTFHPNISKRPDKNFGFGEVQI